MARGDVFRIGDWVEYRTSYKAPARLGVVVGFARHSVLVKFDERDGVKEVPAASAHLHHVAVSS